ncbi:hypothetical protein SALWKB29_0197 [Snodgrassella communis]|uniref:Uncharacterized protein n=1 Tax=Snodgrassella communis TaxID=2946699 RepID=A0A836MT07_9NEIS|nr:hypothetical protein SALWKB29_0197 [Snodgrassella communis]
MLLLRKHLNIGQVASLVQNDMLFIWGTANNGEKQPSI